MKVVEYFHLLKRLVKLEKPDTIVLVVVIPSECEESKISPLGRDDRLLFIDLSYSRFAPNSGYSD